jgi:NADPH:quinone reductase-like Zn-dependent oxidoreductase
VKAAVYRRYGSPDVVTAGELPAPVPWDDEILIRVHAARVRSSRSSTRATR